MVDYVQSLNSDYILFKFTENMHYVCLYYT